MFVMRVLTVTYPHSQLLGRHQSWHLNWLKSYCWEPQKQISFHRDGIVNTLREIKSKLRELALCIKVQHNPELRSLLFKGKGDRQFKHLCGPSKFFSFMAGKVHSS